MEGGAIISHDASAKQRVDYLKNFGFASETRVIAPGINSKMNEMQAALGLLQIKNHESNIVKRKKIRDLYRNKFANISGLSTLNISESTEDNAAYFPIFIDENEYGVSRDRLYDTLKQHNIFSRRYFYPLIADFPMYKNLSSAIPDNIKTAKRIAEQVICLPIYPSLKMNQVNRICTVIGNNSSSRG